MDSETTTGRTCSYCEGTDGNPFWISWETNEREIVMKGDFCSWRCYHNAFENAWDEAANGYPLEIMLDEGGAR
jgi:hypothetical protein